MALIGNAGDDGLVKESSQQTVSLVNSTNLSAATNYYPSSSGQDLIGFKSVNVLMACSGGVTTTIEAGDGTTWVDITKTGVSLNAGTTATSYADTTDILQFKDLNLRYFRVKSITADGSNSVKYVLRLSSF